MVTKVINVKIHVIPGQTRSLAKIQNDFKIAQEIFGKYGLKLKLTGNINVVSNFSQDDVKKFTTFDALCNWGKSSQEELELFRKLGAKRGTNIIHIAYVHKINKLGGGFNQGCGGFHPDYPLASVASHADDYTLAHEFSRILLAHNKKERQYGWGLEQDNCNITLHTNKIRLYCKDKKTGRPLTPTLSSSQVKVIQNGRFAQ